MATSKCSLSYTTDVAANVSRSLNAVVRPPTSMALAMESNDTLYSVRPHPLRRPRRRRRNCRGQHQQPSPCDSCIHLYSLLNTSHYSLLNTPVISQGSRFATFVP